MEISNNINSILFDVSKISFKQENTSDNFLIDIEVLKKNNFYILKSNTIGEFEDIYIPSINTVERSITSKFTHIDACLNELKASSDASGTIVLANPDGNATDILTKVDIDGILYNISGSGGGGGTIVSANPGENNNNTTLNSIAISGINYNIVGTNSGGGTTVSANPGNTSTNSLSSIGISGTNYKIAGSDSNSLNINGQTISMPSTNGTTGQVLTLDANAMVFTWQNNLENDLSINVGLSFENVDLSINRLDQNFNDMSNVINIFKTTVNSNFETMIDELATTNAKYSTTANGFTTINENFNAFDTYIDDICNNHLKTLTDNSNTLVFGSSLKTLPSTFGSVNQVLVSNGTSLSWANQSGYGVNNLTAAIETSFNNVDLSINRIDLCLNEINNTFDVFDQNIIKIDNCYNNIISPNLNSLNTNVNTIIGRIDRVDNSYNSITTVDINNLNTNVSNLETKNSNRVNEINILENRVNIVDACLNTFNSDITQLSTTINNLQNNDTEYSSKLTVVDNSINRIDTKISTEIEPDITTLQNTTTSNTTDISVIQSSLTATTTQATLALNTANNVNSKPHNYLNMCSNSGTGTTNKITMPTTTTNSKGKALVIADNETSFEWKNVPEITKDSDVDVLNLNIYGSSDISGNVRVTDEIVVGIVDGNESIHTTGNIKTNTLTIHNITFPTINATTETPEIPTQNLHHDVSGIHITKSYLHDVDISGVIAPQETSSIVTPSGVTIKFI